MGADHPPEGNIHKRSRERHHRSQFKSFRLVPKAAMGRAFAKLPLRADGDGVDTPANDRNASFRGKFSGTTWLEEKRTDSRTF